MSNPAEECEHVRRLLARLGREVTEVASLAPPRPDVRVRYAESSVELFEVTEVHPDEAERGGSPARAEEERRIRADPQTIVTSWPTAVALPALRLRVQDKSRKARAYRLEPNEALSLLLVGSTPRLGAVASTFVVDTLVNVEQLDAALNERLIASRFDRAVSVRGSHLPMEWR